MSLTLETNAIALLGGSFNPVHIGHVATAKLLLGQCGFSKVVVIPNAIPPHKDPHAVSGEDRYAMAKLAFEGMPNVEVSRIELDKTERSYTFDTLTALREKSGNEIPFYFVLGADAFCGLPEWYEYPKVLKLASYLVINRVGIPGYNVEDCLMEMTDEKLVTKEKEVPEPYKQAYTIKGSKGRILWLETELPEVSSTEIRLRLSMEQPVTGLVPANVEAYLKSKRLYVNRVE